MHADADVMMINGTTWMFNSLHVIESDSTVAIILCLITEFFKAVISF